jgi:hypothetical protein
MDEQEPAGRWDFPVLLNFSDITYSNSADLLTVPKLYRFDLMQSNRQIFTFCPQDLSLEKQFCKKLSIMFWKKGVAIQRSHKKLAFKN